MKKKPDTICYTVHQYATLKKVHENTVRRWIEKGKLPAKKIMRKRGVSYEIYPDGDGQPSTGMVNNDSINGPKELDTETPTGMVNVNHGDGYQLPAMNPDKFLDLLKSQGRVEALEEEVQYLRDQLAEKGKSGFSQFWHHLWEVLDRKFFP